MKIQDIQKYSELFWVMVMLSVNTVSLYNSLQIFYFQYSQEEGLKAQIEEEFSSIASGYSIQTFWIYVNVKLGFSLLSEFVLFIWLSFKVARYQSIEPKKYHNLFLLIFTLQMLVILISIWPFSVYSSYGVSYQENKTAIINNCSLKKDIRHLLICQFDAYLFQMIEFSKLFLILVTFSFAAISSSSFKTQKFPQFLVSRVPAIVSSGRPQLLNVPHIPKLNKLNNDRQSHYNTLQINSILTDSQQTYFLKPSSSQVISSQSLNAVPLSIQKYNKSTQCTQDTSCTQYNQYTQNTQCNQYNQDSQCNQCNQYNQLIQYTPPLIISKQPEELKNIPSIMRPKNNISEKTQTASAEDSLDNENHCNRIWQPSYVTFSQSKKIVERITDDSSFSTIELPQKGQNWNRAFSGLYNNFLDRSEDQSESDTQDENRNR